MNDAIQEAYCVIFARPSPRLTSSTYKTYVHTVTAAAIHKGTGVTADVVADVGKGFRILQK